MIALDNATGQNKNVTVVGLLYFLVQIGLFNIARLSFMIPGHSKFAPDRLFGAIAVKLKGREWYTDDELCAHIRSVNSGGASTMVLRTDEGGVP